MKGSGPSLQTHQSPIPSQGDNDENRPLKQMVPATVEESVLPRQAERSSSSSGAKAVEAVQEAKFKFGDKVQSWWAPWMEGCTEFPKSFSNKGPFTRPAESDK